MPHIIAASCEISYKPLFSFQMFLRLQIKPYLCTTN